MANTIITPTVIAKTALATLYNSTVFAQLVWRDFESDFTGKQGDTITVRKPATFTAENFVRANGITLQNITEDSTTVALDTLQDVSFPITAEELTLKIEDFETRFLTPAMEAHAQKIDGELAEALVDAAESGSGGGTASMTSSTPSTVFTGETGARAKLGRAKIPTSERFYVLSPEAAGVALTQTLFVEADKSGSTKALREGEIGRVFGFDGYESQALGMGTGDKGQADGVAFHRHAVALTTRTLAKPDGIAANQVAVESFKGFGLRVVKAYDITKKQDVISIDCLYGIDTMRPAAAVQLSFALGS